MTESIQRTADITTSRAAFWNWALQHKGRIENQPEVIDILTIDFHDDTYTVDVKLCNANEPGETPYLDCVLFLEGCEEGAEADTTTKAIGDAWFNFPEQMRNGAALEITVQLVDLADAISEIEQIVAQPETDDFTWLRDTIRPKLEALAWATGTVPTNSLNRPEFADTEV